MENPSSPLDTLRQLKEMLDAGALTPTEFEALKQRLLFTAAPPEAAAPAAAVPPAAAMPPVAALEAQVFEPAPGPGFLPEASADFPVAVGGPGYGAAALPDEPLPDVAGPAPAARNSSLGLGLAIAGVLVFLAVVAYLGFNRPATDEHLTSISQTAADSLSTTIETGPQVAPLPAAAAAPETVRVAPTNPAPALPSRAEMAARAAAARDSAQQADAPVKADSIAN